MALELKSDAFVAGRTIPAKYTCDGANVSPQLSWADFPDGTQCFAIVVDDPDATNGPWSHWVLYDIPVARDRLPEGLAGATESYSLGVQGRNDFGHDRYEGPCPPPGPAHHYYFRLYALDTQLGLPAGATRGQVLNRIQGHILDRTELMGLYARSR